ncbi:SirB2 family protein [Klebsiella pneumoniae]|nr:SirB2 family protein [Klebsiella pneumoniae]
MAITHHLRFTEDGAWLTEKLFGVIIYIALGPRRVGPSSSAQPAEPLYRVLLALVVLFIIIQLAITRILDTGVGRGAEEGFRI